MSDPAAARGLSMLSVLEQNLRQHVGALASSIGERNVWRPGSLTSAARYIRQVWEGEGFSVTPHICYEWRGEACSNLEVILTGRAAASEAVVVGAHYDTVPGSPGADDNASGVAALLELARLLKQGAPARAVKLVAFVNEEAPFFRSRQMGSAIYANGARARKERIALMLSLEMLGYFPQLPGSQHYPPFLRFFYPDRGNFIALVSNLAGQQALRRLCRTFRSQSQFPCQMLAAPAIVPGLSWSDHRSFWEAGYKAVMVTDTAFYRYPHYHLASDTADKLDYSSMAQVVDGLARTLGAIAGASP